ncbi:hypothetical protein P0D88_26520 [Paraburkholderia sp. RL18-103-BIB-C]|uniref:hypothetical protein n=1 Tax=Paraburkholderia sp. RL18-103-BIB-C TaxID=3031637 RepID=UPI0038B8BDDA
MQTISLKDDFPPGFYDELARVVVAFGRLEYLIKLCVKALIDEGFTKGMAEAESNSQFSKLCEVAKKRADDKLNPTEAKKFFGLIQQAKDLAEFRNSAVHASWTSDENGLPLRISPSWAKVKGAVNWTRSRVVGVRELQDAREKIECLRRALDAERKAWSISKAGEG